MEYFAKTDTGFKRENNEDTLEIRTLAKNCFLIVVCDGMGGCNGGEFASSLAASEFCSSVSDRVSSYVGKDETVTGYTEKRIFCTLKEAAERANESVYRISCDKTSAYRGMGTTLVAALFFDDTAYILNVGDSRAYVCKNHALGPVTKDHSYVQQLLDSGMITKEEAQKHPKRNVILRAIGIFENVEADLFKVKMEKSDTLLLCTDGLCGFVGDDVIGREIENGGTCEEICERLVALALEAGGQDNVTAALARL